jgi:hypothetical protein
MAEVVLEPDADAVAEQEAQRRRGEMAPASRSMVAGSFTEA